MKGRLNKCENKTIRTYKDIKLQWIDIHDPLSVLGEITEKTFKAYTTYHRRKVFGQIQLLPKKSYHIISSTITSRKGRRYKIPFWAKRESYELDIQACPKKIIQTVVSEKSKNFEDSFKTFLANQSKGEHDSSGRDPLKRHAKDYDDDERFTDNETDDQENEGEQYSDECNEDTDKDNDNEYMQDSKNTMRI